MKKYIVPLSAIIAITFLIILALFKGINGAALASGIAIIAGLGGYTLAGRFKSK